MRALSRLVLRCTAALAAAALVVQPAQAQSILRDAETEALLKDMARPLVAASDIGGYKEVIASIEGKGVFARMKFESGVHRVQRVPVTESGGRIHTSAATVAVRAQR